MWTFGYPFGQALASDEKSLPSISINLGHISSLRKKNSVLEAIQLDAQVNPGNSGGPVLDGEGQVIGIVAAQLFSGFSSTGINFAAPVSNLAKGVEAPIMEVQAPKVTTQDASRPAEFTVSADWIVAPAKEPGVAVELRGDGPNRKAEASKGKDGKYRATIAPVVSTPKNAKSKLPITLEFAEGKVSGTIEDISIGSDGKAKPIGAFHDLKRLADGAGFTEDGKPIGLPAELGNLRVNVGGVELSMDARKATRIQIGAPEPAALPSVYYKGVLTLPDGKVYASEEKELTISSPDIVSAPTIEGRVQLTGERDIELPAPVDDLVAAQDGRTLLLHLKQIKKIAVFDVLNLKIRGYIDLQDDNIFFAGGGRYILLVEPKRGLIRRYLLETLAQDRSVDSPFGALQSLTMGRSSNLALAISTPESETLSSDKLMTFDAGQMKVIGTAIRAQRRSSTADFRSW